MPHDLIIFDCDGVLIDSEVITHATRCSKRSSADGLDVDIGYVRKTYLGRSFATVEGGLSCA